MREELFSHCRLNNRSDSALSVQPSLRPDAFSEIHANSLIFFAADILASVPYSA